MAYRFSFDNAVLHFARSEGPPGFIWKYVLSYLLAAILLSGFAYFLFRPLLNIWFDILVEVVGGANDAEVEAIMARRAVEIIGWVVIGNILMVLAAIAFWAMFEAAIQRRLVRDEGFSLRMGADEFRLIVVGLIWAALAVVTQVFSIVFVIVTTASLVYALDNPAGGAIAVLGCMLLVTCVWIWIGVRLSPASAMTIRDQRFAFFDAWNVTRGRFWTLFWAYVVLAIIIAVLSAFAWYAIGSGVAAAVMANIARFETAVDAENPFMLISAILQFDIMAPLIGGWMFWIMLQGLFVLVWAGPAALAAKTDPRGGGVAAAPDVFA